MDWGWGGLHDIAVCPRPSPPPTLGLSEVSLPPRLAAGGAGKEQGLGRSWLLGILTQAWLIPKSLPSPLFVPHPTHTRKSPVTAVSL